MGGEFRSTCRFLTVLEGLEDALRGCMEVKHFISGRCPHCLRAARADWLQIRTFVERRSIPIGEQEFSSFGLTSRVHIVMSQASEEMGLHGDQHLKKKQNPLI